MVGLGTWQSPPEECYSAVLTALKNGYKHIDTARVYGNEEAVGKAINDFLKSSSTVKRSDLFITTKLWCSEFQEPEIAIKASLKRLQLDYVDLYLMHWPVPMSGGEGLFPVREDGSRKLFAFKDFNYIDTYKLMQPLVKKGYTKAIGISNFNIPKVKKLLESDYVTIVPATNQCELHPYLPQHELFDYCKSKGIVMEAYSPLGSTGAPLLKEVAIAKIAEKYGVSPATVTISWAVSRGTVVLPKSVSEKRIISNIKTIDLSTEDVAAISKIYETTTKRFVSPDWGVDIYGTDGEFKPLS